ncbi:MAG: DUF499 domain-containing protein, partial [Anaerolineae bacterium]|nr:DUF499 domain-containing protein [Anaerolineae bacterium]
MGRARPVYQDPSEFFALTYPTFNLRELAKDVVGRLAGRNDKTVRQLELTYGGGKTHTLITLHHLVSDPAALPDLPAVNEFINHIGGLPPAARTAVLAFDKLDVEKGMEVLSPDGLRRRLRHPWSVMAWQIAGEAGLRLLHPQDEDDERESAPAQPLLEELLSLPAREGLATLVLIDEVLMYAREKVRLDPLWADSLLNFFQYLTQAAVKVEHCAVVASLLATDPRKSDSVGKELIRDMYAIFRREREEGVQPVMKDDVAEVLRRRFFTTDSIRDREAFRPHVVAALQGIRALDEGTVKDGSAAEDRYLRSYPFHPDLTEVFYTKWTQLEGFQRTRGILRTFALALRDAETWDTSPLVSANVFLSKVGDDGISEAARELTGIAAAEEYEGKRQEWSAILQGEFAKARDVQDEAPGLRSREMEAAVMATFLHSQPINQRALTRDLVVLLGHTRPDRIELEKALRRWTEVSWFLDESAINEADVRADGGKNLPKAWRLGSKPNLRQMHYDAVERVSLDLVDARLMSEIDKTNALTAGASAAGAKTHKLPSKPSDIDDDGEFHYAVLGIRAASDSGKPSPEAQRFINEKTGSDSPRVNRNAIVLAVPSIDGLDAARRIVRAYLGWEEVRAQLKGQDVDPIRSQMLETYLDTARKQIPDAIRQMYSMIVTVSQNNDVQAFKIVVTSEALFNILKADKRARIQETAVTADALLPGGPYELWRDDETVRRVKDLVGAFAEVPRLPKMLRRQAILDTLVDGCVRGIFVLRLRRPDGSIRTFWASAPDDVALKDTGLEVVLPEASELTSINTTLLEPNTLPDLWRNGIVQLGDVITYFSGGRVVMLQQDGYEEPFHIPFAQREVVELAVKSAVEEGRLWLTVGTASIFEEPIPDGLLIDNAELRPLPPSIGVHEVLPDALPAAWKGVSQTSARSIANGLSDQRGILLPWQRVRDAIEGAIRARMIEVAAGKWPCEFANAHELIVKIPEVQLDVPYRPDSRPRHGVRVAEAPLTPGQIQELADQMGDITAASVGYDLHLH